MKRLCGRLTAALVPLALILSLTSAALAAGGVAAQAGNIDVTFNGAAVKLGTYNIASNNYVKLRDVAQLLKGTGKEFSVTWNGAAQRIDLTSGGAYAAVGGELGALAEGAQAAVPNSASVWLDGRAVSLTAYTINGNNFFKLRDLGSALNFYVGWDAGTGTVIVDTNKGYVPETPAPAVDTSAMARAMLAALDQIQAPEAFTANARLMDVDGDGVLELIAIDTNEWCMKLFDWKNGALQSKNIGYLAGGSFEWWTCRDTATGEMGILFHNHGGTGGYHGDGTMTYYYPSRELRTYQVDYVNDWSYPAPGVQIDDCRLNDNPITRAEYDAIQAQNPRIEQIFDSSAESGSAENVAAVRAQLNGML